MSHDPLLGALAAIVGVSHVVTDPDVRAGYEVDWTGRYRGTARCVVRPADTAEVAAVVAACAQHGATIVAEGGNTGLVGGSVPRHHPEGEPLAHDVVLSLRRLDALGAVDHAAAQVTAGAGVTIERLQLHARAAGLDFAVDWGARATATVGGAVATNAGGSRVVRFGTMRSQVMGVEAVLADGTVIRDLAGLPKETVGPHLPSLLVGSEGTLAIVTAARVRLVPLYAATAAAFVVVPDIAGAIALLGEFRGLASLDAVEILLPAALAVTAAAFDLVAPLPVTAGVAIIVDCAAHHDPSGELAALLQEHDGVLAVGAERDHLLAIRDHVSLAINTRGVPLKLDVAVPVGDLAELVALATSTVERLAPHATLIVFGHLAEGNLHLNIIDAGPAAAEITVVVLRGVVDMGGTISAEHGVGVAKTRWLTPVKGAGAAAALRGSIKTALDPAGILNPGVLFD